MNDQFIDDLYDIMCKYEIHRIYIAYRNYGKGNDFVENHQVTNYSVHKYYTHIPNRILRFIEKNFPFYYKDKIVKNYTSAYKQELHELLVKYGINRIEMQIINLSDGIVRCGNKICIKNVSIIKNDKTHIDIKNKEYTLNRGD